MRTIINYFRSLFCNHEFKFEERFFTHYYANGEVKRRSEKVSRTCEKCGCHKSYWKY